MKTINKYKNSPYITMDTITEGNEEEKSQFVNYEKSYDIDDNDYELEDIFRQNYKDNYDCFSIISDDEVLEEADYIIQKTKDLCNERKYLQPDFEDSIFAENTLKEKSFLTEKESQQIEGDYIMALRMQREFNEAYEESIRI